MGLIVRALGLGLGLVNEDSPYNVKVSNEIVFFAEEKDSYCVKVKLRLRFVLR